MARRKPTTHLDKIIDEMGATVDQLALAQSFVDEFGGPTGLGKYIAKMVKSEDVNPAIRAQLLRSALGVYAAASEKANADKKLQQLSMEDLRAAISEIQSGDISGEDD